MEWVVAMQRTSVEFPHGACAPKLESLTSPPQWGHQGMSPGMRVQSGSLVIMHLNLKGHLVGKDGGAPPC